MEIFLSQKLLEHSYSGFSFNFNKILSEHKILPVYLSGTKDIWIKDFLPIPINSGRLVQFSLTKDYYYQKDRHRRTNPAPICKELGIEPIIPMYNNKSIYLDGGNVILSPSKTKAILTEKVFADNDIPREVLAGILSEVMQLDKIIFIPVEDGDDTGHSDGMVRFVDDNTVVANDYARVEISQQFRDKFYATLRDAGLQVELVPYHPVYEKVGGYWVATGCYINFLRVRTKVFLPTFNDENDEAAIQRFGEVFGAANVIPVPSLELSRGGGVLNCASWEIQAI